MLDLVRIRDFSLLCDVGELGVVLGVEAKDSVSHGMVNDVVDITTRMFRLNTRAAAWISI